MKQTHDLKGFSLVEVVLALGIVTFVATTLLGMLVVGVETNKQSTGALEATHIGQSLLEARRCAPLSKNSALVLPVLDKADSKLKAAPLYIRDDGTEVSQSEGEYGLLYRITPSSTGASSQVWVYLFWPATAEPDQAQGHIELVSTIAIPLP